MGNGHAGPSSAVSPAAMAAVVVALEGLTKEVRPRHHHNQTHFPPTYHHNRGLTYLQLQLSDVREPCSCMGTQTKIR